MTPQNPHLKGGGFSCFNIFSSFSSLLFAALVLLFSLCFAYILKPENHPPGEVTGIFICSFLGCLFCSLKIGILVPVCFGTRMGSSKDLKLLYDVAVALPESCDGEAAILTDGLTPEDKQEGKKQHWEHRGGAYGHKLEREKRFPADVFSKAWRVIKGKKSTPPKKPIPINPIENSLPKLFPSASCPNLRKEGDSLHEQLRKLFGKLRKLLLLGCFSSKTTIKIQLCGGVEGGPLGGRKENY